MAVRPVLLLGDPRLRVSGVPVEERDLPGLGGLLRDLYDTLQDFRKRRGFGIAIAAPQVGVRKRVVYVRGPRPAILLNPFVEVGREEVHPWEACMSFPDLLVRTRRSRSCVLIYRDVRWQLRRVSLAGELSVVAQHECDHLDGILAVDRATAIDSFGRTE